MKQHETIAQAFDRHFEPATTREIVSLPASVRQRLEEVEGRAQLARNSFFDGHFSEATATLARANAEVFALLAALPLGARQLTEDFMDVTREVTEKEHTLFGVRVGSTVTTTTRTHVTRKSNYFS